MTSECYIIAREDGSSSYGVGPLIDRVNELVSKGWLPIGGVCAAYDPNGRSWTFYQAMWKQPVVKREP